MRCCNASRISYGLIVWRCLWPHRCREHRQYAVMPAQTGLAPAISVLRSHRCRAHRTLRPAFRWAGRSHVHAIGDLPVVRGLASVTVVFPTYAQETKAVVRAALEHDVPIFVRLCRAIQRMASTTNRQRSRWASARRYARVVTSASLLAASWPRVHWMRPMPWPQRALTAE